MTMFTTMAGEEAARGTSGPGGAPPPPPPPPSTINVTIGTSDLVLGTSDGKMDTRIGWTSVHNQRRDATTKAMLGTASTIQNQHLIGFGSNTNPQPGAGAAYDWSFMDSTYGYPTSATGYFSTAQERSIALTGCPPHMRVPKSGQTWDPQGVRSGASLTSLSDYSPPNHSWFQEFADLCAAFAARYPHVKYFLFWNELKNWYFTTQYSGSSLIPPGSGLPAGTGSSNRYWYEGITALWNKIYVAIKAVRPDAILCGPYNSLNSFSWDNSGDWANDAFPDNYMGPWGYGDKKNLAVLRYFIANCTGVDILCTDFRNLTKDASDYFNPPSVPAPPSTTTAWLTNPNGGTTPKFFLEGQKDGAWKNTQRLIDFNTWLKALGASNVIYQRPVADARTLRVCQAEWYAYPSTQEFKSVDPHTGNYYSPTTTSNHAEETAAAAWEWIYAVLSLQYFVFFWKPEGTNQGNVVDYAESNPLALWYQYGSAQSLQPTELKPLLDNLVTKFPPGTQLKQLTFNNLPYMWGVVSATDMMLVSRDDVTTNFQIVDPNLANPYAVTFAPYEYRFFTR